MEHGVKIYLLRHLKDGKDLKQSSSPNINTINKLERCSLVCTSKEPFSFRESWSAKQMNTLLCSALPKLFTHLAKDAPWILTNEGSAEDDETFAKHKLPYVLLYRGRTSMENTEIKHPIGADFGRFVGGTGRRSEEKYFYIGMYMLLPYSIH